MRYTLCKAAQALASAAQQPQTSSQGREHHPWQKENSALTLQQDTCVPICFTNASSIWSIPHPYMYRYLWCLHLYTSDAQVNLIRKSICLNSSSVGSSAVNCHHNHNVHAAEGALHIYMTDSPSCELCHSAQVYVHVLQRIAAALQLLNRPLSGRLCSVALQCTNAKSVLDLSSLEWM